MPRVVDVEKHRRRIAAAAWRRVSGRGIDAVSLRSVAAEAGVSMGQVQHYFATKNDLLVAAVEHSYRLIEQRIQQRMAAGPGGDRELALVLLDELLGTDEETRNAIRVNLAFASRTQSDDRIHELLTVGDDEIVGLFAQVIADARAAGHADPDLDPLQEARLLFALVSGLGAGVAIYRGSPGEARELLTYHLRRIGLAR